MDELVFKVTEALGSSSAIVALAAALLWGVLSVLLSPCHLGTIPLVVGIVGATGDGEGRRRRGVWLSLSFAGGMLVAIAVLGIIVVTAGFAVQGFGKVTNYVIAAVFLLAGLHLTGLLPLPLRGLAIKGGTRKGAGAAAILGLLFGVGLSPCTFAFTSAATSPLWGASLFLAFGIGHCGLIGLAGSSTAFVQRYLDWNERSKALTVVKFICGVLVLVAAGVLIYTA
jgi:cytochrome c-type biogenesis protein